MDVAPGIAVGGPGLVSGAVALQNRADAGAFSANPTRYRQDGPGRVAVLRLRALLYGSKAHLREAYDGEKTKRTADRTGRLGRTGRGTPGPARRRAGGPGKAARGQGCAPSRAARHGRWRLSATIRRQHPAHSRGGARPPGDSRHRRFHRRAERDRACQGRAPERTRPALLSPRPGGRHCRRCLP